MEWCKLYARLPRDAKILEAGEPAAWLFIVGLCHCAEQETDGFIAESALKAFGLRRLSGRVRALEATGLWQKTDRGWLVTNWAALQPTSEKLQVKREKTRQRVAKHRARNAVTNADVTPTEVEVEVEVEKNKNSSSKSSTRATRIPDDFAVTSEMVEWARDRAPDVNGPRETEKFINYWQAKSGKGATKRDWIRTWQNWFLSAQDRIEERQRPGNVVALRSDRTGTEDGPGTPAHFQRAMERARAKEAAE